MPSAAQLSHGAACSQKAFNGGGAEGDQNPGLDNVDLFNQIWPAGLHFHRRRCPVTRGAGWHVGPAFQNVGNVHVATCEPHCFNYSREQLAGATDEWLALCIFICTWRFADKHHIGVWITHPEHSLCARTGKMRAFHAAADARLDKSEHVGFARSSVAVLKKGLDS